MPNIKNLTGKSGAVAERLVFMDEILSKTSSAITPDVFLRQINRKLKIKIGESLFNKDISDLRIELEEYSKTNGIEVFLINKRGIGYYYSINGFKLYNNNIDEEDKNLLLYANNLFDIFSGTSLHQKFNTVVKRLIDQSITIEKNKEELPKNIVQIDKGIHIKSKEWLPQILDAILQRQCLEVLYTNAKKITKKKQLCPYVIKQYNNKWHMVAYDYTSSRPEKTNVFLLDSIKSIDHSNKDYHVDESFNAEDYFKYSIGIWQVHNAKPIKVVMEISDSDLFDGIINNPIHHSQTYQLNKTKDKLTLKIEVYETPELMSLINSFGSSLKVLEPKSLVDKVKENAKKLILLYK
jgi:predicted DNA-binding transcriptional regulator YafY